MASTPCRICLDDMKKPVSLPCGHVFCSGCIAETVKAVKPYAHMHPCPICRSMYNVAPINLSMVPPNLRPFVTPSVRRLFLDKTSTEENAGNEELPDFASSSAELSEISRLRAENLALKNNCALWRRRAEMHGTANLGLLNFARAVRDQASLLARERDGLQKRCHALKRKIEDNRISRYSDAALAGLVLANSDVPISDTPDADSLLFAPPPFNVLNYGSSSTHPPTPERRSCADPSPSSRSDLPRPRKRTKIEDTPTSTTSIEKESLWGTGTGTTRISRNKASES